MDTPTNHHTLLYREADLVAVLDDMARQCLRLFSAMQPPLLIGVRRRGEPLAQRLQVALQTHWPQANLPVQALSLKRYADDLQLLHPDTALTENPSLLACDLARQPLLLVDDVLYQGHSLLRAVNWLVQHGTRCVRTAVLVDRCIAQLPIRADVVGLALHIPDGDVVECHVPPYEPALQIWLWHRP